jgi:putative ABC transport system permease protein
VVDVLEALYRRFPATFVARRNLTRNRVRSILTVLGIAIGVVAVASLGIAGNTFQTKATGSLSGIGSTLLVQPAFDEGVQEIPQRDLERIEREADGATVVPLETGYEPVRADEQRSVSRLYATGRPANLLTARSGDVPERFEDGALVGSSLADKLEVEVGDEMTVAGDSYAVEAVLESERSSVINPDSAVFLPPSALPGEGYSTVVVDTESATAANATAQQIRSSLNDREKRVTVTELADQVERVKGVFGTVNKFLTGVAAISLFVAGVGILNVMLMSAVERRQEVGVLRAVGLRRFDVLKIMLIEASLLGLFGSALGGALSVGTGVVVNAVMLDAPMRAFDPGNLTYLVFAVGFGVLIGVLSGVYPAWKASRERPVEALRH